MDNKINNEFITNIVVECPHCKDQVLIEKLNCCIFRHGSFKRSGNQIGPHTEKQLCDLYIKNDLIFGCGKPFQVIINFNSKNEDDKFMAIICDYI
jgi:hypothetical protein